jgi:hypothetical protein
MTEENEKKEESETKIKLSDFIENITHIEFKGKGKAYRDQDCNGYITFTIHGITFIEMFQKFFEWIKNNKEFQELQNANEVAEKI